MCCWRETARTSLPHMHSSVSAERLGQRSLSHHAEILPKKGDCVHRSPLAVEHRTGKLAVTPAGLLQPHTETAEAEPGTAENNSATNEKIPDSSVVQKECIRHLKKTEDSAENLGYYSYLQ